MTIRLATAADASAVAQVAAVCLPAQAWSEAQWAALPLLWVADYASVVAGYVALQPVADEAEVLSLAVLPEHRRRGIAHGLLFEGLCHCACKGALYAYLEVRASSREAQAFYRAFGFVVTGRRPHYYHAPEEDAVLMACRLGHAFGSQL